MNRNLLSADQSKAARALLNWSRVRLAAKANLSEMTIRDFENGFRKPRSRNIAAMRQALEDAGIVFSVEGTASLAGSVYDGCHAPARESGAAGSEKHK